MENKEFFENNSALTHKMIKMLAPNVEGLYIYSLVHGD